MAGRSNSLDTIIKAFGETPAARETLARLPPRGGALRLGGLPGSSSAVLAAWLARELPQRLFVVVAPTPTEADRWLSDLIQLLDQPVALYPQREALGEDEPHYEIAGERAETLEALLRGRLRVLVTTARATAERTRMPATLTANRLELAVGSGSRVTSRESREGATLKDVTTSLERMGYERVPMVTEVAQFSVRGGIVDVYGFGMAAPARIEWWGDDIESIRAFDLTNQRSGDAIAAVTILPIRVEEGRSESKGALSSTLPDPLRHSSTLFDLLPGDALLIQESTGPDAEEVSRAWREAEHHLELARRMGEDVPTRESIFQPPDEWRARLESFPRLTLRDEPVDLMAGFLPPDRVDRDLKRLRAATSGGAPTIILCDNEGQLERLDELLHDTTLSVGPSVRPVRRQSGGRLRHAEPPGPHRPRDLPSRPAAPPGPALPAGRADVGHRRPHAGRLRGASRSRHRDLSRTRHHRRGRRRQHHRRRGGRVRGRRQAQRAALRPRPAGALSRLG